MTRGATAPSDSARGDTGGRGHAAAAAEGHERRLSHEESHKPELTDWEWCRSKSERTPRQVKYEFAFFFF